MKGFLKSILAMSALTALGGCAYHHPSPDTVKDELKNAIATHNVETPRDVASEMRVPNPLTGDSSVYATSRRFHVQAQNVEAKEFFASLVTDSNYSIIVHPQVVGTISVDLQNVTIGEVLNSIASMYGFDIEQKGKIFYVYPYGVRTETFAVDYLQVKRSGQSSLNITTGSIATKDEDSDSDSSSSSSSNSSSSSDNSDSDSFSSDSGTSVSTQTEHDFWTSLESSLKTFIGKGEGKSVIVNPESGLVVVSATPSELKAIRTFLDSATKRMNRQVLIEAKVLEVSLSEGFQHGINWSLLGSNSHNKHWSANNTGNFEDTSSGVDFLNSNTSGFNPANIISSTLGNVVGIKFTDGSTINAAVNLLQTQGDVSILSSPRITATNNQKAVIKVGEDEYFVTSVSSNTITNSSTSQSSPDVEFTPFFSGVSLDVTPQIDNEGKVVMHIHPAVIEVQEQQKNLQIGESKISVPMAKSSIRETDTIVKASSGDVIIIGGLMKERKSQSISKVPLLGNIPVVGELFKNTVEETDKVELVILLRPVVVEEDTWKSELRRSNQLLEKWYPK